MQRSGQAANVQSRIGSPGKQTQGNKHRETNTGKQTQGNFSKMSNGAKQDFAVNEMESKAYIEWVMGCSCVISAMND